MKLLSLILASVICSSQAWALGANAIGFQFTVKTKRDSAFAFAYPPKANKKTMVGAEQVTGEYAICSVSPAVKANLGKPISCLFRQDGYRLQLVKGVLIRYVGVTHTGKNADGSTEDYFEIDKAEIGLQPKGTIVVMDTFENLLSLMSAEKPMHLVFDADTGRWYYGLNPDKLMVLH